MATCRDNRCRCYPVQQDVESRSERNSLSGKFIAPLVREGHSKPAHIGETLTTLCRVVGNPEGSRLFFKVDPVTTDPKGEARLKYCRATRR